MLVILAAAVVERVSELMSGHSTESTILKVARPFLRVEGWLKDTGWEDDLAIRRS